MGIIRGWLGLIGRIAMLGTLDRLAAIKLMVAILPDREIGLTSHALIRNQHAYITSMRAERY
jgi:hypothetical protein